MKNSLRLKKCSDNILITTDSEVKVGINFIYQNK